MLQIQISVPIQSVKDHCCKNILCRFTGLQSQRRDTNENLLLHIYVNLLQIPNVESFIITQIPMVLKE